MYSLKLIANYDHSASSHHEAKSKPRISSELVPARERLPEADMITG